MMIQSQIVQGQPPKEGQRIDIVSGLGLPAFDKVTRAYDSNVTETYTFAKRGVTVAVVVIVYTTTALTDFVTVTRTS